MNWNDLDALEKTAAGGGVFGALLILGIKAISFFRAERVVQAGSGVQETQMRIVNETLQSMGDELSLLRGEVSRMDKLIHANHRKITRLEIVVRRLVGLLEEHDISMPAPLVEEIDDLLKDEPMNRRATDKPATPQ